LKRGLRQILSLVGTTLRKRAPSNHEPRVQKGTPIRAADGDGEEVDEAEVERRLPSLGRPAAWWSMAKPL
jgi:hypothetical protein